MGAYLNKWRVLVVLAYCGWGPAVFPESSPAVLDHNTNESCKIGFCSIQLPVCLYDWGSIWKYCWGSRIRGMCIRVTRRWREKPSEMGEREASESDIIRWLWDGVDDERRALRQWTIVWSSAVNTRLGRVAMAIRKDWAIDWNGKSDSVEFFCSIGRLNGGVREGINTF